MTQGDDISSVGRLHGLIWYVLMCDTDPAMETAYTTATQSYKTKSYTFVEGKSLAERLKANPFLSRGSKFRCLTLCSRLQTNEMVYLNPWPNGLASRCKSTQVSKTRTCVRTCDGWPNGFAIRLASSAKLQKTVNFTHTQMTCDVTVKNLRRLATNLSSTKSTQVHASRWPNEMQVEQKLKTCADLRIRFASGLRLV